MEGVEFATSEEIKKHCQILGLNYDTIIRSLLSRGHLLRVFRGVFYVKSSEEIELATVKHSPLELVARGLELKGVRNWYFGLHTALKLNNLTHEHFAVDEVINDKIFRARPITIAGHEFRFIKVKPSLLSFGIVKEKLRYSDPEKTILDFIYLWRYNGVPDEKIIMDISEWARGLSNSKMRSYLKWYPTTVKRIAEKVMR
ncbi:MAG: hypothetical protein QW179_01280 [Candidatus Hadarchaeales archaeon]